jgi:TPR repeat protein
MRSKRIPDRVHVVRPPEQDDDYTVSAPDGRTIEIVRTLAQISDKLKRSEAERFELLAELREYRKALNELEDKTSKTEKAYIAIEHKLQTRDQQETDLSARQTRFEKALKDTEEKLVKNAAGQALIDKRISDYDGQYQAINQRLDESATEQVNISRQIEKVSQEKARMMRKVERLEEIAMETQESLRARALVLLTDQSAAAQSGLPQLPAWNNNVGEDAAGTPWFRRSIRMQSVGMGSMVVAALLLGWAINQIQQPEVPQIAMLENGGLARLNLEENRWEAIVQDNTDATSSAAPVTQAPGDTETPAADETATAEPEMLAPEAGELTDAVPPQDVMPEAGVPDESVQPLEQSDTTQTPNAEKVLNYNDDEILSALEKDPEQLASDLNEIAPDVSRALDLNNNVMPSPMANFDEVAYVQDPKVVKAVAAEKAEGSVAERIAPDASLPKLVRAIEQKALEGDAEAQHDLAAIYTAGHGGVKQDFERAAMWFREASDNGIANARYNLGVLYHQGLGVKRDLGKALYWYREAATLSHPEAQYNLGIAYIEGIGTEYNAPMAASYFQRAANNGIMEAAYNLGLIYENGLLGEPDTNQALLWYKVAADQGSSDAQAAIKQLSKSLQIGPEDVDALVERLQKINVETTGRRAGPTTQGKNG